MSNKTGKSTAVPAVILAALLLLTMFGGCGKSAEAPAPAEPVLDNGPAVNSEPVTASEPVAAAEPAAGIGRKDGERFEDVIGLEGMEETVRYEHVRNETVGFELDYEYESLARQSGSDQECFISIYEDP